MGKSLPDRYARALISASFEKKMHETVSSDMNAMFLLFEESKDLPVLLKRAESFSDVSVTVAENLSHALSLSSLTKNLINLLVSRKRLGILSEIVQAFRNETMSRHGIVQAKVTSIRPLSPDEKLKIEERLAVFTNSHVEIKWLQDRSILGGLYIQIGDRVIDGTLRTRMNQLQDHLLLL